VVSAARTLRLAARARLEGLTVVTPTRRLTAPAEHRSTLDRLAGGGVADDASALLDALDRAAALAASIAIGDGRVTVEPEDDRFRLARAPVEASLSLARAPGAAPFSSLAYGRREGTRVVVRRPGAPGRAVLEGAGAVALLASPTLPADVAALLAPAGLLAGEEEDWEWYDLVFHARTHGSGPWLRADPPAGPPPPDAKPAMDGEAIALAEADLSALAASDAPLTAVLERRRSLREHDDAHPVDVAELGALLHRAAARRELLTGSDGHERSRRVAPSGGGVSALELYPAVRRCSGLGSGLYHYEADAHRLRRIGDARAGQAALELRPHDAAEPDPQVLVLAALRYPRIAWSYRGIAYQLGLLDLGVLYQTLYLVTTAMGLAGCAYGTVESRGFAALTGISPGGEAALGAFSVGRPNLLPRGHQGR
jgi:SagB-type dehydrogenase family enzyme